MKETIIYAMSFRTAVKLHVTDFINENMNKRIAVKYIQLI